jgi:hypothetical protein
MKKKLRKVTAYLDDEEYAQFKVWVAARGVGVSGFIREQLTFAVRRAVRRRERCGGAKSAGQNSALPSGLRSLPNPSSSSIEYANKWREKT